MRSVVAVSGDPGGANALAPVLKLLSKQARVAVRAFAYNEAVSLWTNRGIECEPFPTRTDRAAITHLMSESNTGLLLTGTSMNSLEFEKQFVAAARDIGLPSLAVLDFWSNYRRRFSDKNGRLVYLPDRIAVMDEQARRQMMIEGIDPALIIITGHPNFDDLAGARESFTAGVRTRIREVLNVGPEDLLVVFASQPLGQMFGTDESNPMYLGYDEREVLLDLIAALERVATRSGQQVRLVIRPHPRERADSFGEYRSVIIDIVVSTNDSARDMLMAADLVAGMSSNLLVEACYLGCIVVSMQPGLRGADPLPTNREGFSRALYRKDDIEFEIWRLLTDEEARAAMRERLKQLQLAGGATERVVDLIYQMMGVEG